MLIIPIKSFPRRTLIKTCPICKNLFPQKGKGNKKYCNPKCASIAKAHQRRDVYHTKQLKKIQICPNCTRIFQMIKKRNMQYCSPKCAAIAKKQQTIESNEKMLKNRDPIEHAKKMRELYHKNLLKKNKEPIGTITIPPTPIHESTTGGGNL